MFRYALTIFLSAFLLFQVQPMIAKFILPWFGGTSSVWTTCMLFFQVALLLGYCYSHFVTRYLSHKKQWLLHAVLLLVALFFLPVQPNEVWKPSGTEDPTWRMLLLLTATIGFPFFLLSTTGPLIQAWQSKTHTDKSAYRLFAVSNFGSLLGLLGYPFLVEPYLRLGNQSLWWSIGFGIFACLCLCSGWQLFAKRETEPSTGAENTPQSVSKTKVEIDRPEPGVRNCVVWTLLAFAASAMLLATTNQMCQEVASVPFLWVLPLALYLMTFIICFENQAWYRRWFFFPMMFISVFVALGLLAEGTSMPLPLQVGGYSLVMFACCMTCHGELAQAKPAEKNLTLFYLMVSVGGALGGIFVVVIAPRIFNSYFEFHVSLVLCVGLSVLTLLMYQKSTPKGGDKKRKGWPWNKIFAWALLPITVVVIGKMANNAVEEQNSLDESAVMYRTRNSYGTLYVKKYFNDFDEEYSRSLINGRIKHGAQSADPYLAVLPASYYATNSGIGSAFAHLRSLPNDENQGLRIGVVGLGTGTMAAWAEKGDSVKFYEINPAVEFVARKYFTYIKDSLAGENIDVVIGDARIQMEKHFNEIGSEKFDMLAIDAFSSDAIPMHLLTRECFKLYCDNLSDEGILAIHVSNRYLDLGTIVYNLANELGHSPYLFSNDEDDETDTDAASWVLVTRNSDLIQMIEDENYYVRWESPMPETVWTDDFGSLTEVMDFRNTTDFAEEKWDELLVYMGFKEEEGEEDDFESEDDGDEEE